MRTDNKDLQELQVKLGTAKAPRFQVIPLTVVILLILNFLVTCSANRAANQAKTAQPVIYVHDGDGNAVAAKPKDPLYRPEPTVRQFALNFIQLGFTWNKKLLGKDQAASMSEAGTSIPTPLFYASFALQPGFREQYLKRYSQSTTKTFPLSDYTSGAKNVDIKVFGEPKVEQVAPGLWDVTVVATRIHHANNAVFANELFNHVLRVRAVLPAQNPWGDRQTFIGSLVRQMQVQGLQIDQITQF